MKFNTKINSKKSSVGFIGAGNMGLPMIKNIIKAGFNVKVFDWNIKVTKKLDKEKIIAVNNLRAIAKSDFIISMLPNTTDVESVFNNETGINQFLIPGTIIIDMSKIFSTSSEVSSGIAFLILVLINFLDLNSGPNITPILPPI